MAELEREVGVPGHQPRGIVIVALGGAKIARFLEHVPGLNAHPAAGSAEADRLLVQHRRLAEAPRVTRRVGARDESLGERRPR